MRPNDPALRARQIAALRAAYEARPSRTDDRTGTAVTHQTKALLGRILLALGESRDGVGGRR